MNYYELGLRIITSAILLIIPLCIVLVANIYLNNPILEQLQWYGMMISVVALVVGASLFIFNAPMWRAI